MKIVLQPGDRIALEVGDGTFEVLYDYQGDGKLRILADMPDTSGRGGLPTRSELEKNVIMHPEVYCEDFGAPDERVKTAVGDDDVANMAGRVKKPIVSNTFRLQELTRRLRVQRDNHDPLVCIPEATLLDEIRETWEKMPMDERAQWHLENEPPPIADEIR